MTYRVTENLTVTLKLGDVDLSNAVDSVLRVNVLERAGTDLPMLTMAVTTRDREVPRLANEGNPLRLTMGVDGGDQLDATFLLQHPSVMRGGEDSWTVHGTGIKHTLPGWARPMVEASRKMSGVERIIEVAKRAGERIAEGSLDKSQDSQSWLQYGNPNKLHVDEIWLHCDLGKSFPLLANTLDGFRVLDAHALARRAVSAPDHRFGNTADSALRYDWNMGASQMAGMLSSVGARGQTQPAFDLDAGEPMEHEAEPEMRLAMGDSPVSAKFGKVANVRKTLTRNMHKRYWECHAHNHTQLALYSSSAFTLTFADYYLPIHPLDAVELLEEDILGSDRAKEKEEAMSGLYVVSKVARMVQGNSFKTSVQLTREAFNSMVMQ